MGLPDARCGEQGVSNGLIHAHGGAGHPAAHIRDARQLKQPLNRAVLAVFAVQGRKHAVQPDGLAAGVPHNHQAVQAGVGRHKGRGAALLPAVAREAGGRALIQQPAALLGDADFMDIIFCRVQIFQDRGSGHQGDLVLRGLSAEDHAQAQLITHGYHAHFQGEFADRENPQGERTPSRGAVPLLAYYTIPRRIYQPFRAEKNRRQHRGASRPGPGLAVDKKGGILYNRGDTYLEKATLGGEEDAV